MKKILKMVFICIEASMLFVVVGGMTSAITKSIYADILIEQFKNNATLDEEASTNRIKVYRISTEEERPVVQKIGNNYYPGNGADILLTLKSEIQIPFIYEFVSFFAGGHAALVLDDYEDFYDSTNPMFTIESSGLNEDLINAEVYTKTYWEIDERPIIGLRVKMTEEERKKVISRAMALAGDPYNGSFLFDTKNKSYCSDLIAKAYQSVGVDLNKDGFTTSVYDLLISGETYITYYSYVDLEGVKHIYY